MMSVSPVDFLKLQLLCRDALVHGIPVPSFLEVYDISFFPWSQVCRLSPQGLSQAGFLPSSCGVYAGFGTRWSLQPPEAAGYAVEGIVQEYRLVLRLRDRIFALVQQTSCLPGSEVFPTVSRELIPFHRGPA